MERSDSDPQPAQSAVTLSLLAPAFRCNQRCPACILDQVGEPVHQFDLTPDDYATFLRQFVEARVPIHSVLFQGYEVTLAASWPYVEATFAVAQSHGIRRGFITNGMLLSKWTERIQALEPYRIAISLDGTSPDVNDRFRGLPGAFGATLRSTRAFLARAPEYLPRTMIASCLYGEEGFRSLRAMPELLKGLGLARWSVSPELVVDENGLRLAEDRASLVPWLEQLREDSAAHDIDFHVSDEFGWFDEAERERIRARSLTHPERLIRMDPLGFVRRGEEIRARWHAGKHPRWDPRRDNAVVVTGIRQPHPQESPAE